MTLVICKISEEVQRKSKIKKILSFAKKPMSLKMKPNPHPSVTNGLD